MNKTEELKELGLMLTATTVEDTKRLNEIIKRLTALANPLDALVSLPEIRKAIANYMRSEGCGCCRDTDAHEKHEETIAKLLKVPMYEDGSGYDFKEFRAT